MRGPPWRRLRVAAFLGAAALALAPAAAQEKKLAPPAEARPPAAGPAAPAAIPLPAVVRSAEETHLALRRLGAQGEALAVLREVAQQLPGTTASLDRMAALLAPERLRETSERDLADLRQLVIREEMVLGRWDERLEAAVRTVHAALQELRRTDATWKLTEEALRAERAPAALVDRVVAVQAEVGVTAAGVQERIAELLALQDRVAAQRLRNADWMAEADRAEEEWRKQLFEIESRPLWEVRGRGVDPGRLWGQLRRTVVLHAGTVRDFVADERDRLLLQLVVFVGLAWAIRKLGRRIRARASEDPSLAAPAEALAHPVAASLLLTVSATSWSHRTAPATVNELVLLGMLLAILRVLGGLVAATVRSRVYALTALFAVERLGALLPEHSLAGRLVLLAVAAAALAAVARALRRGAWADVLPTEGWRAAASLAGRVGALLLAGSLVSNLVGNVTLAKQLARGTLASAAVAVSLAGIAQVLRALLLGSLRLPALQRIEVVARHGDLVAARIRRTIRWGALALWAYWTAASFRVVQPVRAAGASVLAWRLQVGGLDVSLGDVAAFAVTLLVAVLLARFLRFALQEGLENRGLPRGIPAALSRTAQYVVVGVGFGAAILASGMEVTRFAVLIGTLGVGIGFGLQNVVNNFVSGLILLYERPVQVGDVVELGTLTGTVDRIGIRSSTVRTFQGAEVVVPNANLISGELVNWTLSDRVRRVEVDVGVAYGSDPERVREVLLGAVRGHADVLASPEPLALLVRFGESSLDFQLRFWTHRFDAWAVVASEARLAVHRALAQAGIAIPFPQRDLHLASVGAGAARVLGKPGGPDR